MNMKQQSCDGRGARSALFGVAMRTKRRVRAAHARPKPTSFDILKNGPKNIHAGESAANFSYSTSAATKPSIKAVFRKFLTKQRRRFIAGRIRALVKLDIFALIFLTLTPPFFCSCKFFSRGTLPFGNEEIIL